MRAPLSRRARRARRARAERSPERQCAARAPPRRGSSYASPRSSSQSLLSLRYLARSPKAVSTAAFQDLAKVCLARGPNTGSSAGSGDAGGGGEGSASASALEELQRERCGGGRKGRFSVSGVRESQDTGWTRPRRRDSLPRPLPRARVRNAAPTRLARGDAKTSRIDVFDVDRREKPRRDRYRFERPRERTRTSRKESAPAARPRVVQSNRS